MNAGRCKPGLQLLGADAERLEVARTLFGAPVSMPGQRFLHARCRICSAADHRVGVAADQLCRAAEPAEFLGRDADRGGGVFGPLAGFGEAV